MFFKCIVINIKLTDNRVTNIISLYRPLDTCMDNFTQQIEAVLTNNKANNK